jgi:hypothetical protein
VNTGIHKETTAFVQLRRVKKVREISDGKKVGIFKSNVISVLLYGCETLKRK